MDGLRRPFEKMFDSIVACKAGLASGSKRMPSVLVSLSIRHGHLSEASQEKITAKAQKLLRIFERLTAIEVIIDLEDESQPSVDLQVSAEHKHDFVAREQAPELMAALDRATHKVEQQLRKYKERIQERHRDRDARRVEGEYEEVDVDKE